MVPSTQRSIERNWVSYQDSFTATQTRYTKKLICYSFAKNLKENRLEIYIKKGAKMEEKFFKFYSSLYVFCT
jgi:hypothetical protein